MSKIVTMTANGNVPLPADVRTALGIAPGGDVALDVLSDGAVRLSRPHHSRIGSEGLIVRLARVKHLQTGRDPEEIMRDIRGDDPFPP